MSLLKGKSQGKRRYTAEEKAGFFLALGRSGIIAVAARDVGLPLGTCHQWAIASGFVPKQALRERRSAYLVLRAGGVHRGDAARQSGVNIRTARDWDQGIRRSNSSRVYPDGRVIDYTRGVTTFHSVTVSALEAVIDARYLSLREREKIRDLMAIGASIRVIAKLIGRSPGTVSRELRRNATETGTYEPYAAHRVAAQRRPRPTESKLAVSSALRSYVEEKLAIRWSPEQICHGVVKDFPDDQEMRVSPETIYQALYFQARGGLRKEVQAALRTGRARRTPQNTGQERRSGLSIRC